MRRTVDVPLGFVGPRGRRRLEPYVHPAEVERLREERDRYRQALEQRVQMNQQEVNDA